MKLVASDLFEQVSEDTDLVAGQDVLRIRIGGEDDYQDAEFTEDLACTSNKLNFLVLPLP